MGGELHVSSSGMRFGLGCSKGHRGPGWERNLRGCSRDHSLYGPQLRGSPGSHPCTGPTSTLDVAPAHTFPQCVPMPNASWDPPPPALHPQPQGSPSTFPSHQCLQSDCNTSLAPTSLLPTHQPSPRPPANIRDTLALAFDPQPLASIPPAGDIPTRGLYSTLSLLASGSQDPHPCSASPGLLSQPQTSTAPGQAQRPRRPRASKQSLPRPQHCALSPSQRLQSERTPFSPLTSTPHTRAPALPS